ncbi:MAG: SDR family NAD(P)-dependent oxidoreductase [Aestuariivita sp.]|nr:SDR family NAD(P)-dependent oxidoreductase [Aestuariivita sp.]
MQLSIKKQTQILYGKHAIVIGGGTGIGLAIAQMLADEGALVTITGRNQDTLNAVTSDRIIGIAMDVRNETHVCRQIKEAVNINGPIQICIPNAGIAEGKALYKTTTEFWRNMMATNLDGAFYTIRESLNSMRKTNWGRVITISSIAGLKGQKGAACYTASKHGLVGLTRALSEDFIDTGITFNTVCPGYVDTPLVRQNIDSISKRSGLSKKNALELMISANRNKRLISTKEVAATVLWLCQYNSSSINGQAIEISGGQV